MEAIANFLTDSWTIILTILGFSFIIFVHELGHFIMAKRAGVRVEKFFVGFDFGGLKVFSIIRGDTEYGIGIFPFGGYVKLHGYEELPGHEREVKDLNKSHFQSKTVGERLGIMAGGVAMNFISAVILILIMYGVGKEFPAPVVGGVHTVSAIQGGLKEDDKILSINGKPVKTFIDIRKKVVLAKANEPMTIKVERNKEIKELTVKPEMNFEHGVPELGLSSQIGLKIGEMYVGSPASLSGLLPGDVIESINGEKIDKYYQFYGLVEQNPEKEMLLGIRRNGTAMEIKMTPTKQPSFMMQFDSGLRNVNPIEILNVTPDTAAEKAGIQPWDRIVKINDKFVSRIEDISAILAESKGSEVELEIIRNETILKVPIAPIYNSSERKYLLGVMTSQDGNLGLIDDIEVNGPAYNAGLRVNDRIVSFNDIPVKTVRRFAVIAKENYEKTINISYERLENGVWKLYQSKVTSRKPTRVGFLTRLYHKTQTLISKNKYIYDSYGLGINLNKDFYLAQPLPDSPAAKAGFQLNDKLISISFKVPGEDKMNNFSSDALQFGWNRIDYVYTSIASRMSIKNGQPTSVKIEPDKLIINIKYERDGKLLETSISPLEVEANKKGFSGIEFNELTVLYRYSSIGEAFSLVYTESLGMLEFTVSSFSKLVSGDFGLDALSGPFGILPMMHKVAKSGILETLYWVAFLSVNIGFMNFLPFPPLDGGSVFFLLIEKLKGSPVSAKFQIGFANVGILCLIALMLFVTMNDISKM